VTFYDGKTALGQGTLSNCGFALSTTSLAPGTHTLAAVYSGDSNFNPNASNFFPVAVTAGPPVSPDYSFALSAPDLIIVKGQTGPLGVTITSNANLSASVSFTCSGLPRTRPAPSIQTCSTSPRARRVSPP
jgi:hypothetical protein